MEVLHFIYLPLAEGILTDDEWAVVEWSLIENPRSGVVVPGTDGVRKVRVAFAGRGKWGSARVVYLYINARGRVYFLFAYAKNKQEALTPEQKRQVRRLVATLKEER